MKSTTNIVFICPKRKIASISVYLRPVNRLAAKQKNITKRLMAVKPALGNATNARKQLKPNYYPSTMKEVAKATSFIVDGR